LQRLGEKLVSWASVVDDNTLEQARTSSLLPFIWPHVVELLEVKHTLTPVLNIKG
jgi:hypothetical protein